MTIATKEFHHFNVPPGQAHAGASTGAGAARGVTASTSTGPAYIVGASSDGTYFVDQNGQPRLMINEDCWELTCNGGRYSGNYNADVSSYMAARAAQGYTSVEVSAISGSDTTNMVYNGGRDWDGTYPFNSTMDPVSGFNNTFWVKRDYLIAQAALHGITVVMSFSGPTGNDSQYAIWTWTTTQWAAYGTGLGNRYKNTPNILWIMGDEVGNGLDAGWEAAILALKATGDTHLITIQNSYPTTSRTAVSGGGPPDSAIGPVYAQYDWVYDYWQSYTGVIVACQETPRIPAFWADGYYIGMGVTNTTSQRLQRNNWWWSLSSGGCGAMSGDGDVWPWPSGAVAALTSTSGPAVNWYTAQAPAIAAYFSALPGWWKLRPDTTTAGVSSGSLVKTGRGTMWTGTVNTYYESNTDTWVTAAIAADKSLAVIYMSHPTTITIDQSQMAAGYTATWVDPASCATSGATPGTTYNSTAKGTNSDGDADWVLVLQGP